MTDTAGKLHQINSVRLRSSRGDLAAVADGDFGMSVLSLPTRARSLQDDLERYSNRLSLKYYVSSTFSDGNALVVTAAASKTAAFVRGSGIDEWEIQYPIDWESEEDWVTLYGEQGATDVQDAIAAGVTAAVNESIALALRYVDDTLYYDTLTFLEGSSSPRSIPAGMLADAKAGTRAAGSAHAKAVLANVVFLTILDDDPCEDEKDDVNLALAVDVLAGAAVIAAAASPGVGWVAFGLVYGGWIAAHENYRVMVKRLNRCKAQNPQVYYPAPA